MSKLRCEFLNGFVAQNLKKMSQLTLCADWEFLSKLQRAELDFNKGVHGRADGSLRPNYALALS